MPDSVGQQVRQHPLEQPVIGEGQRQPFGDIDPTCALPCARQARMAPSTLIGDTCAINWPAQPAHVQQIGQFLQPPG